MAKKILILHERTAFSKRIAAEYCLNETLKIIAFLSLWSKDTGKAIFGKWWTALSLGHYFSKWQRASHWRV